MDAIFKNYEAFHNMLLATTIMSNAATPQLKSDAKKIIEFIGTAYKHTPDFIDSCISIILEDLISLGLIIDQQAVCGSREYGYQYSDKDSLLDIKSEVLTELHQLGRANNCNINASWFDYSHYKTYQPDVRFVKINITSASGNLIATKQAGILKALGIGCTADIKEATKRLLQCVFWGDIASMHLLAYTYSLAGDQQNSLLFYQIAELSQRYLNAGYTVLPQEATDSYSEEACRNYVYISSIKQDIIYAYDKYDIDFSFVEAITSATLDHFQRLYYINNYEKKEWRNVTNSSDKPARRLGFN